jgi:hypothetical protein
MEVFLFATEHVKIVSQTPDPNEFQVYGGSYCSGHMESVRVICQFKRELMSRLA